jgi:multidrug resistance efflux pump
VFEKAEKDFQTLEQESRNLSEVAQNADARVSALNRDLDAARKILEGRLADAESSKLRVEAGQVTSPVSGVVAGCHGDVGAEVHPTMEDLFQIATDVSRLMVAVEPSPDQLARIKPEQFASVSVADLPHEPLSGVVRSIEDGRVRIEFANPSALVKPGQTAQVRIQVGRTGAL